MLPGIRHGDLVIAKNELNVGVGSVIVFQDAEGKSSSTGSLAYRIRGIKQKGIIQNIRIPN